jgi:UDP-3-O-[3-hydroxymyristoyl] glucosamine N-acyltransferase
MGLSLNEIVARLGGEVVGNGATLVQGIGTLAQANSNEIAFLANPIYRDQLVSTQAGAVILSAQEASRTALPCIVSANPYAYFARTAALFQPSDILDAGIHGTAVVAPNAKVSGSAIVGALVSVGAGARIGDRSIIHSGVQIGDGVVIGADCIVYPNCVIYHGCEIGERVIIHGGAVIGADGFGFAFDAGEWIKVPQVGRVRIENDVEIGANTTIDRGAIDDTVIEIGVKLDNQIQIGHNVRIGAHTVIAGCAAIAGSTSIGRHCRIGGGVGIVGHVDICDGVTITARTLVTKSIRAAGVYSGGLPHMGNREWLKATAHVKRLEQLANRVEQLENELKDINKGRTA